MEQFNSPEELMMNPKFQEYMKNPTAELVVYWEEWKKKFPEQAVWVEEAKALMVNLTFPYEISPQDKKGLWERIRADVERVEDVSVISINSGRKAWYWVAAALAALIAFTATFYLYRRDKMLPLEFATNYGEIKDFQLPDGSQVTLNGNSKIRFKRSWEKSGVREVWVDGEVFFSVSKIVSRTNYGKVKFVVHCNGLNVEVLGTQFNVVSRKSKTKVSLNEGKIRVLFEKKAVASSRKQLEQIVMVPGEIISYSASNRVVKHRKANPELSSSWKDHKYIFNNTSINEVIEMLEETYGVDVQVKDQELLNRTIDGTIYSNKLDVFLKALSVTNNLKVVKQGEIIILQKK